MPYPPAIPADLATGDIINEPWVDGVRNLLNAFPWGPVQPPIVIGGDQTGISALVDLTGFAITVPVTAGRWYEVAWQLSTQQVTTAGAQQVIYISLDGSQAIIDIANGLPIAARTISGKMHFYGGTSAPSGGAPNLAPGPRVIKLRGQTNVGTMSIGNSSLNNGRFSVVDIGS